MWSRPQIVAAIFATPQLSFMRSQKGSDSAGKKPNGKRRKKYIKRPEGIDIDEISFRRPVIARG
jgi:hypothetical protein